MKGMSGKKRKEKAKTQKKERRKEKIRKLTRGKKHEEER